MLRPFDLTTRESAAEEIQEIENGFRDDIEADRRVDRRAKLEKKLRSTARGAKQLLSGLGDLDVLVALHDTAMPPVWGRVELSSSGIQLPPFEPKSADQVPLLEALESIEKLV